jgi:hypothetical protein
VFWTFWKAGGFPGLEGRDPVGLAKPTRLMVFFFLSASAFYLSAFCTKTANGMAFG